VEIAMVEAGESITSPRSPLKYIGIGCLGVVIVLAVLVAYIAWNWRAWSANQIRERVMLIVETSGLPQPQREAILADVDALAEQFKAGEVSTDELRMIAEQLQGILPAALVYTFEVKYLPQSGLDEQEMQEAALTAQRYARGLVEGRISDESMQKIVPMMTKETPQEGDILKTEMSDEQVRDILAIMTEQVEAAGIPAEPYVVDFATRIDAAITSVLGPDWSPTAGPVEPAATQPTTTPAEQGQ